MANDVPFQGLGFDLGPKVISGDKFLDEDVILHGPKISGRFRVILMT